jgi:hypothetical protein
MDSFRRLLRTESRRRAKARSVSASFAEPERGAPDELIDPATDFGLYALPPVTIALRILVK